MAHQFPNAAVPRSAAQQKGFPASAAPGVDGPGLHVPIRCQFVPRTQLGGRAPPPSVSVVSPNAAGRPGLPLGGLYRLDGADPPAPAWPARDAAAPPPPARAVAAPLLFDPAAPPFPGLACGPSVASLPLGALPTPEAIYPPLFQGLPLAVPQRAAPRSTPERRPSFGSLFQPSALTQPLTAVQNVAWLHGPGFPDIQLPAECWTAEPDFIRPPSETLLSPIGRPFQSPFGTDPPLFPPSRGCRGSTPRGKGAGKGPVPAFPAGKGLALPLDDTLTPAPAAAAAGLTALVGPMDDSWARRVAPSGGEPAPADGAAQGLLQFAAALPAGLEAEPSPRPTAVAPPEPDPALQEAERQLVVATEQCLTDPVVNPFQGSLAIEKVQNIIRRQYPDLYAAVVGQAHRAWNHFIQRQPSIQAFESGFGKWRLRLTANEDWEKRDEAAQAEQTAATQHLQRALVEHLAAQPDRQSTLDTFLEAYPHLPCNQLSPSSAASTPSRSESNASSEFSLSSTSDSASEHGGETREPDARRPSTPVKAAAPKYPLPKRGDVARFVKREGSMFSFDAGRFMIRLLRDDALDDLLAPTALQLPPSSPPGAGARSTPVPAEC